MVKKIIVSIVLMSNVAFGDWSSYMDGALSVHSTGSYSFKSENTIGATLGGFSARWKPIGVVYPIHIEKPKISVGCNGIDIQFGSVSYLQLKKLVKKLKQIVANSASYAFFIAIQTVASQIADNFKGLEKIIDKINNFSFDSCSLAQKYGGRLGKAVGNSLVNAFDTKSKTEDPLEAQAEISESPSDVIKDWWGSMDEDTKMATKMLGLFWNRIMEEVGANATSFNGKDVSKPMQKGMFRTLFGDISWSVNGDDESINYIQPATDFSTYFAFYLETEIEHVLQLKICDANVNWVNYTADKPNCNFIKVAHTADSLPYNIIKKKVETIVDTVQGKYSSLHEDELNFYKGLPSAIREWFHLQAINENAGVSSSKIIDIIAKYMAVKTYKEFANWAKNYINAYFSKYYVYDDIESFKSAYKKLEDRINEQYKLAKDVENNLKEENRKIFKQILDRREQVIRERLKLIK